VYGVLRVFSGSDDFAVTLRSGDYVARHVRRWVMLGMVPASAIEPSVHITLGIYVLGRTCMCIGQRFQSSDAITNRETAGTLKSSSLDTVQIYRYQPRYKCIPSMQIEIENNPFVLPTKQAFRVCPNSTAHRPN